MEMLHVFIMFQKFKMDVYSLVHVGKLKCLFKTIVTYKFTGVYQIDQVITKLELT